MTIQYYLVIFQGVFVFVVVVHFYVCVCLCVGGKRKKKKGSNKGSTVSFCLFVSCDQR